MKGKFKQRWSIIPTIWEKKNQQSPLISNSLNGEKIRTYDIGNLGPGLGKAQIYSQVLLLLFNLIENYPFIF